MAVGGSLLLDNLRGELKRGGVKLWLPPYTLPAGEEAPSPRPLASLAATYAARIGGAEDEVAAALEELRLHALSKLRAKTRVTLLARVAATGQGRADPLQAEFDASSQGADVRADLCKRLGVAELKAIAGGRCLQDEHTLGEQGWACDADRGGQPLKVLLFPSGEAKAPTRTADSSAVQEPSQPAPLLEAANHTTESEVRCSVAQIREAAEQLTSEGFGDFELSDAATGRLVPVLPAARQALIAAVALHSLGRESLYQGDGEGGEGAAASALEFLAEADRCFERCRQVGAAQLLEQIDNFGQLQLDICWAYALLGDADHLPDAERRLEAAERLVRRRVDRNFLTLAEVKAEQGHLLPPDVLPSVRLWLLRGVARRFRGDYPGAKEDLARAATFIKALRVDDAAVDALLSLGATRAQAVAALRRCGGSRERAAEELVAAEAHRRAAKDERHRQRELGQTQDGSFVDEASLAQLLSMGLEKKAALEALKKANNDVLAAVDIAAGERRAEAEKEREVDGIALASLVSLGFELSAAEAALRATASGADMEEALLALTAAATTGGGSSGSSGSSGSKAQPGPQPGEDAAKPEVEREAEVAAKAKEAEAEAERAAKRAKKNAMIEARAIVERELGNCLNRAGVEDDLAGASLQEEEMLVQQHLSALVG